ncbi:methyltransferase [Conexibacter sp. SYSU D00693]|uniref:class I SAM-dependent methyltransferase n=1 Tax=Conexibacter sp. SYSU D00693 TaxID=2812560 RepID=UPI00196B9B81|nr:methyltransferase domain-containing protein [Conexibacter sp. SYSU D00693]
MAPLATPSRSLDALRESLVERLRELRGPMAPIPRTLLELELRKVEVPGGAVVAVKPDDWPALREEVAELGWEAPYWAAPWPSGLALAHELAGRDLRGKRVLELGCGLGIASAVAARQGATVLATDADPCAAAFAAHTIALNEQTAEVAVARWPDLAEHHRHDPFDLLVAADVLYRRDNAEDLARALPLLVAPDGEALVADPGRAGAAELWPMLRRRWRRATTAAPGGDEVELHALRRRGTDP